MYNLYLGYYFVTHLKMITLMNLRIPGTIRPPPSGQHLFTGRLQTRERLLCVVGVQLVAGARNSILLHEAVPSPFV